MSDLHPATVTPRRNLLLRAVFMILMAMAFQLASTLLGLIACVQLLLALLSDAPNGRLTAFGQSLGQYLRQIADFVSFGTEAVPFPFTDWPARH